jgi:hypothetical protein
MPSGACQEAVQNNTFGAAQMITGTVCQDVPNGGSASLLFAAGVHYFR